MITYYPRMYSDFLGFVSFLGIVVQKTEDEIFGWAGDVLPLLLRELYSAFLYVYE